MDFSTSPTDEIKQRIPLVDFIQEFIPLTPAGANFKARCPFHTEKTPSFMVSRDKGIWHCFGCGKGGDLFTFLQEYEGLEFSEALRLLAARAGVQLRAIDPKLHSRKTRLHDLLRASADYYRNILLHSPLGAPGRAYLQKRAIAAAAAAAYGVGFAPESWDGLLLAMEKLGYTEAECLEAGLCVKRERAAGSYDRFRGRLMFPIRDHNGTTVGFGGRLLQEDPEHPGAKYLNSPQTIVYNKSAILFGLDLAKPAIRQAQSIILVEGYLDCLSAQQAGTEHVVATAGTALTPDQVSLLKRYATTVLLAFDADAAGIAARDRSLPLLLGEDLEVRVVPFPDAKDPDELIRRDINGWRQAVASAPRFMEYYVAKTFEGLDPTDVGAKKAAARKLLPVLALLGDPIEQEHYLKAAAAKLGVTASVLREHLPPPEGSPRPQAPPASLPTRPEDVVIAERLLAFFLRYPQDAREFLTAIDPEAFPETEHLRSLYKQFVVYYTQHQRVALEPFLDSLPDPVRERATRLSLLPDRETLDGDRAVQQELAHMTRRLQRSHLSAQLRMLSERIRAAEGTDPPSGNLPALLERFSTITEQLRRLS